MLKIKTPLIAINFKTYLSATGKNAQTLAKVCAAIAADRRKSKGASVLVAVQPTDIATVAHAIRNSPVLVFAQHIDFIQPGAHTGHILAQSVKQAGAIGTLLNHSEHQIPITELSASIAICKSLGLSTIVCASTVTMARSVAKLNPDFVAYEPPELIGGDVSVTTRPQALSRMVKAVRSVNKKVRILVGAGVKSGVDVSKALELGTHGVLLASGVAASKTPIKALIDLCSGVSNKVVHK